MRDRNSHPLAFPQNACSNWDGARRKPGARSSVQVSCMRTGTHVLEFSPAASPYAHQQKLKWGVQPKFKLEHTNVGCSVLTPVPNTCPTLRAVWIEGTTSLEIHYLCMHSIILSLKGGNCSTFSHAPVGEAYLKTAKKIANVYIKLVGQK